MMTSKTREDLVALLDDEDRGADEVERLASLILLLSGRESPPDPAGLLGRWSELSDGLAAALETDDGERIEERFLELYCHLHGHEAPYTRAERSRMDRTGGYWCHAGGMSPILKAPRYLEESSVSADFGAGNGLQCLLMQKLAPHAGSVQYEISSRMVEAGQALQEWLGIPHERVDWIVTDVCEVTPDGLDFIYLYRPVRPETDAGRAFYTKLAAKLERAPRPVTIFSIADPLGPFLDPRFRVIHSDGHLTCYQSR